jgi:GNAT superfamily N-acetyltransferase
MVPLISKHYKEIARFKDFRVEPDFSSYKAAEAAGNLRIYTARFDKQIVGFSVFQIYNHPHFKSAKQAYEELFYLDPIRRKGDLGDKLISYCDEQLSGDGLSVIYHAVAVERDFSLLLLRNGYELADRIYAKVVA